MNLNDKLEEIKICGALGYSPEKIAIVFDLSTVEKQALLTRLSDPSDTLYIQYHNGRLKGAAEVDIALAKQARIGDKDGLESIAKLDKKRKIDKLKKELFGI